VTARDPADRSAITGLTLTDAKSVFGIKGDLSKLGNIFDIDHEICLAASLA